MTKLRVCEVCGLRPAVGVLRLPIGRELHVCVECVPNSPMFDFQVYLWLVDTD